MEKLDYYIVTEGGSMFDYYVLPDLDLDKLDNLDFCYALCTDTKEQAQKIIDEKLAPEYPKLNFKVVKVDQKKADEDLKRFAKNFI